MAKITEKRLYSVSPQLFTSNGTATGSLTVADSSLFVVGHIVIISSSTQPPIQLKVKRIPDANTIFVGDVSTNIKKYQSISTYLVADGASIQADEQTRPIIPEQEVERITYAEEPIVARRVFAVDKLGNGYSIDNPLPVQLSDGSISIGTVNAEVEVQLSHQDNVPNPGDVADSVRIGDGVDELSINPDGSINVVISSGASGTTVNQFYQVSSVVSGSPTTIGTYTVPLGNTGTLQRVVVGGNNVATYELNINASLEGRIRTWFSGPLTESFEFGSGLTLVAGTTVQVVVSHSRPFTGDFEARIQVVLT